MAKVNFVKAILLAFLLIIIQQCSLRYIPANFRYSLLTAGNRDDESNRDINGPCTADDDDDDIGSYGPLGCNKHDRSKASHDLLSDALSNSKSSDVVESQKTDDSGEGNEFKLEEPTLKQVKDDAKDNVEEFNLDMPAATNDVDDSGTRNEFSLDEPKKNLDLGEEFNFEAPADLKNTKSFESRNDFNFDESKKEENVGEFKLEEPKREEDFIGEMKFGSATKDISNEREGPEEHAIFSLDEHKKDLPVEELKFNSPEDLQNTKDLETPNKINFDVSKKEKNLEVDDYQKDTTEKKIDSELNEFNLEEHQVISKEKKKKDFQNNFKLDMSTKDIKLEELDAPDIHKSTKAKEDLQTQGDFKLDGVSDAPITMADSHEDITKEDEFRLEEPEHGEDLGDKGINLNQLDTDERDKSEVEHKFSLDEPKKENLDLQNEFKLDAPDENDVSSDFTVGNEPMNLFDSKAKTNDESVLQTNPEEKRSDDPFSLPESDIVDEDTGDKEGERNVLDEQNLEVRGNMMDIFSDEPDTNLRDVDDSFDNDAGIEDFFH